MENQDHEKDFIKKVKRSLDFGEKNIDARTQAQLKRIRQQALKRGKSEKLNWRKWVPVPLPALAATAVAVFAVVILFTSNQENNSSTHLEDLEILASNPNLEFYENLDFYAWLDEEELNAG